MTPYYVVVVGVVLPMYCHIGSSMPYLYIFVEEVVAFLGTMTDKWISFGRELKHLTVANACLLLGPPWITRWFSIYLTVCAYVPTVCVL